MLHLFCMTHKIWRQNDGCQGNEWCQDDVGRDLGSAAAQDGCEDLKHHPDEEHDVDVGHGKTRQVQDAVLQRRSWTHTHTHTQSGWTELLRRDNQSNAAVCLTSGSEVFGEQQFAGERKDDHHHGHVRRTQATLSEEEQRTAPQQQTDVEEALRQIHATHTLTHTETSFVQ